MEGLKHLATLAALSMSCSCGPTVDFQSAKNAYLCDAIADTPLKKMAAEIVRSREYPLYDRMIYAAVSGDLGIEERSFLKGGNAWNELSISGDGSPKISAESATIEIDQLIATIERMNPKSAIHRQTVTHTICRKISIFDQSGHTDYVRLNASADNPGFDRIFYEMNLIE
ncbi:hypothetical protein [Parerythrobacter jejuensis]|uniref:Lipoprotein n=1 Tax=Parerythrobacter jejuensis TaxID=795812 RepID=A0A845AXT4_9SPHN|nr:hypothetical protein [Parerythrobacter jejuensis]MXP30556.1 hypothetical protein [Parerythrobacter jejuensis]MXP33316.1 hypothetical protein [Parerythrobacter jejuensis]